MSIKIITLHNKLLEVVPNISVVEDVSINPAHDSRLQITLVWKVTGSESSSSWNYVFPYTDMKSDMTDKIVEMMTKDLTV